jgi:hypothetical protein
VEEHPVPAANLGKIVAGIAGTAGTGSVGISGFVLFRLASAHVVLGGAWAAAAAVALPAAAVLAGCLALVLQYRLRKLELRADADQKKQRLDVHGTLLEKAAGEPANAQSYRDLIIAEALYLSVEQNGAQLTDKAHQHLYGHGPTGREAGS